MNKNEKGRGELAAWEQKLLKNSYLAEQNFQHTISFHLPKVFSDLDPKLKAFAETVIKKVVPLVHENNLSQNLPSISNYNSIGKREEKVIHHPSYEASGNLIYNSGLMGKIAKKGGLSEGLAFLFLSSHAGEAGHNCPIACSAGIIRVLQKVGDFPEKESFLKKLTIPSYSDNYTGAQFVTEVQGGSDAGQNATRACRDEEGLWRIEGEKWFCSNANADLILMTARYDPSIEGTKGLGLFLVPAKLDSGEPNRYAFRRLKDKLGTRSMATAEIDFHGAYAIPMGPLDQGFKLLMENVLHISRLFNTICVTGMARRAFQIAKAYAECRTAFGQPIINYPLVQENLARIRAENVALTASIFATLSLQDVFDREENEDPKQKLLLRLLANLNKYLSALWTVEHIHHCLDVLAGNGTIETFSTIPLLLRDSIICENWEGTHNVLRMQILRDILRYQIDEIFLEHLHEEINTISHSKKDILSAGLRTLREKIAELKEADDAVQALMIKPVVDQMGILYSALQLLREAIDQEANGSRSKQDILDYFIYLHLNRKEPGYDRTHLDLIRFK